MMSKIRGPNRARRLLDYAEDLLRRSQKPCIGGGEGVEAVLFMLRAASIHRSSNGYLSRSFGADIRRFLDILSNIADNLSSR